MAKNKMDFLDDAVEDLNKSSTTGVHAFLQKEDQDYAIIELNQIDIRPQVRKHFDPDALAEMAAGIKESGVLQPILVRRLNGRFELIAGERRVRASNLAGMSTIKAIIFNDLSDEKARRAQIIENIQRENLSIQELASALKADIEQFGSVEQALVKGGYNKSPNWAYKILGVLDLPEHSARLVSENITADVQVINGVRQVEKHDPEAAAELVEELKLTEGKGARAKVDLVRNRVKTSDNPDRRIERGLNALANQLQSEESSPSKVFKGMTPDQEYCCDALKPFFSKGTKASKSGNAAEVIMTGLADGKFAAKGAGALRLSAFLRGMSSEEFDLQSVFKAFR